jgi:hypothetical protein
MAGGARSSEGKHTVRKRKISPVVTFVDRTNERFKFFAVVVDLTHRNNIGSHVILCKSFANLDQRLKRNEK